MQDHILIVDDDHQETSFLKRFFSKHGYRSTGVGSSSAMFDVLANERADLVVLDLILPDEDGLDAARRLQQKTDIPIIMLSARDEPMDKIIGLELGADDYLTKPYEPRELLARVRSVLRRYRSEGVATPPPATPGRLRFAGIEIDPVAANAIHVTTHEDLGLTGTEFLLLSAIAEGRGEIVPRSQILDQVYGETSSNTDRAIDAHIVRLRKKLAAAAGTREVIATIHGRGYRLAAAVSDT